MSDLSAKTVCFVDNGLFMEFASKVAKAFRKAYYYVPHQDAFASLRKTGIGVGDPHLERIHYPLLKADEIDLWVFLDIYLGDLQVFLSDHGARVWGAKMGEELELFREQTKKLLAKLGLPVGSYVHASGLSNLIEVLKGKKDVYVKTSFVRDEDTWKHRNMVASANEINRLRHTWGELGEELEFDIEDAIEPAIEIGYDGPTIDGQFPDLAMQGLEIKGLGLAGHVKRYADLAEPIRLVNAKLSDVLRKFRYRGFWSTEIRYGKERKPYLIDPCCRLGSPSNELLQEILAGWPQFMWDGADGKVGTLTQVAKYGMILMVYHEEAGKEMVPIQFPAEDRQWIKLRNAYRDRHGNYWLVPQGAKQNIAAVVALGDTLEAAQKLVRERAERIVGMGLEIGYQAIDETNKAIAECVKYGIQF